MNARVQANCIICSPSCTQIMRYAEQRIPTLNEYCVVCDERHVFQNGPMLKVRVHTRKSLVWQLIISINTVNEDILSLTVCIVLCVYSQRFAAGSCVCFPFICWGLCLEQQKRLQPVQRSVTPSRIVLVTKQWSSVVQ